MWVIICITDSIKAIWNCRQGREVGNDERWIIAIEAADEWGKLDQLVKLLREATPLSDDVREILADLIASRGLGRRRSSSPEEIKLLSAAHVYRMQWGKRPGETRDQRIARVAREEGVPEHSLRNLLDGKGRLSRRVRRRDPTA
jgi:hypothetical protein